MLETAIGSSFKLNQGIGLEIGIVLQLGNLTTYHFFFNNSDIFSPQLIPIVQAAELSKHGGK